MMYEYGNAEAFKLDSATGDEWRKFYNKDGTLKAYAFSCGYVEIYRDKDREREIWFERLSSGAYEISSAMDYSFKKQYFDNLRSARAALRAMLKE